MPMIDQVHIQTETIVLLYLSQVSNFLWKQGEKDDKIIAVCADDPEYRHYSDIKDLPPHRLAEIRRFFEDCILLKSLLV